MSAPETETPNPPENTHTAAVPGARPGADLPPAALRALAEAAARRADIDRRAAEKSKEVNGVTGPEPTRYGDWERKGIASDF